VSSIFNLLTGSLPRQGVDRLLPDLCLLFHCLG
jgi:hypothetical protein